MAKHKNPNRTASDHGKRLTLRQPATPVSPWRTERQTESLGVFQLINFEVTWDVIPDPNQDALPQDVQDRMPKLFDLVYRKPRHVVAELRELSVQYPQVLCLRNWLISALRGGSAADFAEALAIAQQLFQERPDYFFARLTLTDLYLEDAKIEKADELLFGTRMTLTELYPARSVFHFSEVRTWLYLCAKVKFIQGESEMAENFRHLLEKLEPDADAIRHLNKMMKDEEIGILARLAAGMRKLMRMPEVQAEHRKQRQQARKLMNKEASARKS